MRTPASMPVPEMNGDRPRIPRGARQGSPGLLAKILTFVVGSIVLVGALLFSFVLFAVLLAVGLIAGAYLWWQTRELRGQLREQMRQAQDAARGPAPGTTTRARRSATGGFDDRVIDGDYVRETGREKKPDDDQGARAEPGSRPDDPANPPR